MSWIPVAFDAPPTWRGVRPGRGEHAQNCWQDARAGLPRARRAGRSARLRRRAARPTNEAPVTETLEDIVAEGERVLGLADEAGVNLRLLGGVAVRLRAPELPPALAREYKDLDFAVPKKAAGQLDQMLR